MACPAIQEVDSNNIHFTYVEGMEGAPRFRSLVWRRATNELSETNFYPQLGVDRFEPTGEAVVAYQNESYPNSIPLIEGISAPDECGAGQYAHESAFCLVQ